MEGVPVTDMLVNLYRLADAAGPGRHVGVVIRKPLAAERTMVVEWVAGTFGRAWADEVAISLTRIPVACYVAQEAGRLIGFACYDASALGYFGPTGVSEDARGRGIGSSLLMSALHEMRLKGYGYAVIGWVGPQEFYARAAGAIPIPDSSPGIWADWLGAAQ